MRFLLTAAALCGAVAFAKVDAAEKKTTMVVTHAHTTMTMVMSMPDKTTKGSKPKTTMSSMSGMHMDDVEKKTSSMTMSMPKKTTSAKKPKTTMSSMSGMHMARDVEKKTSSMTMSMPKKTTSAKKPKTTMSSMSGMHMDAAEKKTTMVVTHAHTTMTMVMSMPDKTTKGTKPKTTMSSMSGMHMARAATKTSSKAPAATPKYTFKDVVKQMKLVYQKDVAINKSLNAVTTGGFGQASQLEALQSATNDAQAPGQQLYKIVTGSAPFGIDGAKVVIAELQKEGPGQIGLLRNFGAHKKQFANPNLDITQTVIQGLQAEQKSSVALTKALFAKMPAPYAKGVSSVVSETNKEFASVIAILKK